MSDNTAIDVIDTLKPGSIEFSEISRQLVSNSLVSGPLETIFKSREIGGDPLIQAINTRQVHKFGGSSLADTNALNKVVQIIEEQTSKNDIIVVSANGKMTDKLVSAFNTSGDKLATVKSFYTELVHSFDFEHEKLLQDFENDIAAIYQSDNNNELKERDLLVYGEIWSARLLCALLKNKSHTSVFVDARNIFVVDLSDTNNLINNNLINNNLINNNLINFEFSTQKLDEIINANPKARLIVTGYIASDQYGNNYNFGRNGSDYTATLIGQILNIKQITLWTDVAGVFTADPNVVKNATPIKQLSLCEMQGLSELGSNVLHPKAIEPLLNYSSKVLIKSAFNDSKNGTEINQKVHSQEQGLIKTIAVKSNLNKIHINNISELESRIIQKNILLQQINFYAEHYNKTRHQLSFYVEELDEVLLILESLGFSSPFIDHKNVSLLSVVGQDIRQDSAVIRKVLTQASNYELLEIYYPSNSHCLSVIVPDVQSKNLLQDLHTTFFEQPPSIPIFILGYGNIGQQFVHLLTKDKVKIEKMLDCSLSIVSISNSKKYLFDKNGINSTPINLDLGEDNTDNQFIECLNNYYGKKAIIIDLTANQKIASLYLRFAQNNWHIISANKITGSNFDLATVVEKEIQSRDNYWLQNTTAGAGLPIQASIKNLTESGDVIQSVSGIFSGSLSWLFSQLNETQKFSSLLKTAQKKALTEPDPRDDLSGKDVLRKVKIIARELGYTSAKEEFEPAIKKELLEGTLEDFWSRHDKIDEYYSKLFKQAREQNSVLCYVATITPELLKVKLEIVNTNHAFANLNPCDNIFQIQSIWYAANPLIIQGPGAGREVTAAGVLNDLIYLLRNC